jgi:hypothetical protein
MDDDAFNTLNYVEIWFDDGLWVLRYVYKNVDWDMFYELCDELRFHVILRMKWKVWDTKCCINVWKHVYNDYGKYA